MLKLSFSNSMPSCRIKFKSSYSVIISHDEDWKSHTQIKLFSRVNNDKPNWPQTTKNIQCFNTSYIYLYVDGCSSTANSHIETWHLPINKVCSQISGLFHQVLPRWQVFGYRKSLWATSFSSAWPFWIADFDINTWHMLQI